MILPSKIPSFNVVEDGVRIPTIEYCFIEKLLVDFNNPLPVITHKGVKYQAVYESFILPKDATSNLLPAIGSFQKHTYGNFVVIRNFREKN